MTGLYVLVSIVLLITCLLAYFSYQTLTILTDLVRTTTSFRDQYTQDLKTEIETLTAERDLAKTQLSQLENTILKRLLE